MLSWSLKLAQSTCPSYYKVCIPLVERLRDLNLNFTFNSTMKIIMSRQTFRHLELQNSFTSDDFMG